MQKFLELTSITEFFEAVQASEQFRNSCRQLWQRNSSGEFREIFYYNQESDYINNSFNNFIINSNKDYYITKNSFYADERKNAAIFSLDNIVIDLDNHLYSNSSEIENQCTKLLEVIRDNVNIVPFPSCVVLSGRGCQLWYHISSVSYKLMFLYRLVCVALCEALSGLIEDNNINLKVDKICSYNAAALCRLPLSWNTKTGYYCKFVNFDFNYNLNMLILDYDIRVQKSDKNIHNSALSSSTPAVDYKNLLFKRVKFIENLVKRSDEQEGRRNNLIFMYYNSLVQLVERSEAVALSERLNSAFASPLPLSDLQHYIFNAVDKQVYKFKDTTFFDFLELSEVEINLYKNLSSKEKKKQATAERKAERNKKIQQLAVDGVKQAEIANIVGCSEPTVRSVLKSVGFSYSDFQADKAKHLYRTTSMSKQEIADALGVSLSQVYVYLKK